MRNIYLQVFALTLALAVPSSDCRVVGRGKATSIVASSVYDPDHGKVLVSAMQSPEETWRELEEGGAELTTLDNFSILARSLSAGIFVGFGGILAASVGFDMGTPPWEKGQGVSRLLSGVVGFPLAILLVSITGNGAWTGDALLVAAAWIKKRCSIRSVLRFLTVSYIGCFAGTFAMACMATVAGLPCIGPCIAITEHKLSMTGLQTFARGIGGGALITLAIFLSKCSRMMTGKIAVIIFTIGSYVICDFEHVLASMFFLATSFLNQGHINLRQFVRQLAPSTLGNLVGGALFVGCGLSSIPRNKRKKNAKRDTN